MAGCPLKSSRCLTGSPIPSPEEIAIAPVPHHRANLDSRANRNGSPTSHTNVAAETVPMPGSSRQGGALFVEELVDVAFERPDLAAHVARSRSRSTARATTADTRQPGS